jgi:sialate O-acetylesterase
MRSTIPALLVALHALPAAADVALPAVFGDRMVLQRDVPVRVFGAAQPGEQVDAELRDASGAVLRGGKAVAGQGGRFSIEFGSLSGGPDPLVLEVRGANTVTCRDVVVGDLWVAGGQSNMEWPLGATGAQAAAAAAEADPLIRFLRVPKATASHPLPVVSAPWAAATPPSLDSMGAVGFWFAKSLRKATGMPVGIIESNWGGSRAEPWTDLATLGSESIYVDRVAALRRRIDNWDSLAPAQRDRAYEDGRRRFQSEGTSWWNAVNASEPGIGERWFAKEEPADADAWKTAVLPAKWSEEPEFAAFDGVRWYRRTVDIPAEWEGKEILVELGAVDDADILFFDGRAVANTIADWTTARRYRVPGSLVKAGPAVLALEVLDMQGEGGLTGDPARMRVVCPEAGDASVPIAGEWRTRAGRDARGIAAPPTRPARDQGPGTAFDDPAAMHNAMIAPFAGTQLRGAIWYQGESNTGSVADAEAYATLLPLTIRSWRATFEQPSMPFGIVSLAAFHDFSPGVAVGGTWPILRDAQLSAERTSPNAGVVTTIDVGDAKDIHPRDKRTVGERLARWALATAHGKQDVAWRGPRTKSARRDGDGILVDFDVERGRLGTRDGKAPAGFAIAGADGQFFVAETELRQPSAIRLRSDKVPVPTEVRYAWQDNPANANVIDEVSALPAHPFRIRVEVDPIREQPVPAPQR